MKYGILLLTLVFFASLMQAQIGATAGYVSSYVPVWEQELQEMYGNQFRLFAGGERIGLNYWLPLKSKRIEFLPSVEYTTFGTSPNGINSVERVERFNASLIGAFINTRIYPFDFQGDCTCPTFSKGGDFFQKGLFVMVSPGVERFQTTYEVELTQEDVTEYSATEWKASLGGSVGLDIGISELVTLTPLVGVRYSANLNGDHLIQQEDIEASESGWWQLFGGIHIGLRFKK